MVELLLGGLGFVGLLALTAILLSRRVGLVLVAVWCGYGLLLAVISVRWHTTHRDALYLPNLPGALLGDALSSWGLRRFGDPRAVNAGATVPWLLQRPQVYVPASVLAWGLVGLVLWLVARRRL
jgi:hypothetical protein